MFARLVPIAIVSFWLLMTGFMVRRIHFPESAPASPIPVSFVMDTFFGQDSPGGQYDVFQSGREIGFITVIPRERESEDGMIRQIVLWNAGSDIRIRWKAVATLSKESDSLAGIDLEATIIGADFDFEISARPDSEKVDYKVRRHGTVIADSNSASSGGDIQTETARALLSSWGFSGQGSPSESDSEAGTLMAYDQILDIAGRKREVYSLVASLGPDRDITLYFSRAGELIKATTFLDYELRPSAIIID